MIRAVLARVRRARGGPPRTRYDDGRVPSRFVDELADEDLERLNGLLPWQCFTVDSHGRPFGGVAWEGKRAEPQEIPDPRIVELHRRFDLSDRHVLEVGCFEGVHTIALCRLARSVTAVDARVENVTKTVVRCAFFDAHPRVATVDLEEELPERGLVEADVCHHVGVLYHLSDPVRHMRRLCEWVSHGVMIDTHYAEPERASERYEVDGRSFAYMRFRESGQADPFSGVRDHAKWLQLEDIVDLLREGGLVNVEVAERRAERNGPRALIFAHR